MELSMRLDKAGEKARRDAERIISEARETAEVAFAELDEMRARMDAEEDHVRTNEARAQLRRKLNEAEEKFGAKSETASEPKKPGRPAAAGDTVEIISMGVRADVVSASKDGTLNLRAGIMNVTARQEEVCVVEDAPKPGKAAVSGPAELRAAPVTAELDLRGLETLEAIPVLDRFIDSAVMGKLHTLTIIHGKGTGALRQAVQQSLKSNKTVKSFRLGHFGEGETGVTIVELK
jgi:DNA mismatch repair protein MutS2